jgi:hypothetical protein
VYGTLDDSNVIEEESARADIVLRKLFCLSLLLSLLTFSSNKILPIHQIIKVLLLQLPKGWLLGTRRRSLASGSIFLELEF